MVFKVQILQGNKPDSSRSVSISTASGIYPAQHTGNGWYEAQTDASSAEVHISTGLFGGKSSFGLHPHGDTIIL